MDDPRALADDLEQRRREGLDADLDALDAGQRQQGQNGSGRSARSSMNDRWRTRACIGVRA